MILNGIVKSIEGKEIDLSLFQNKVVLVVNTASRCGFTPQYKGLEKLYRTYKDQGFVVLGFPCNQFGNQESGSDEEIQKFCSLHYQVSFPIFSKIKVNGPQTPLFYTRLKEAAPGLLGSKTIKWNFTKFLIEPSGQVTRFAPTTSPQLLQQKIEQAIHLYSPTLVPS